MGRKSGEPEMTGALVRMRMEEENCSNFPQN
jgi:hypothetical protein